MSSRLAELCTALVDNAYGQLASQIFSALADHGRQTLPGLSQITRLPLRQLKTGLGILIQHHILLYFRKSKEDEDEDDREPTFYSVNWDNTYCLLRARKIVKLVTDREGEAAGRLLGNVLQLGHASIGDLATEYGLDAESKRDRGIEITGDQVNGIAENGTHKTGAATVSDLHSLTRTLLKNGCLIKVGPRTYLPRQDFQQHLAQTVMGEHFPSGKVSAKKKEFYMSSVNQLKRKYEEEDSYQGPKDDASRGTLQRAEPPMQSNKRVKSNGDVPNGIHHPFETSDNGRPAVAKLPDDMVVCINFKKCTTLLRSIKLERMAAQYLGPVTGAVYRAILHSIEDSAKYVSARDKPPSDPDESDDDDEDAKVTVSDLKVLENLSTSVNLEATIKRHDPTKLPNGDGNPRKRPLVLSDDPEEAELGIKREAPSDDEEDKSEEPGLASLKARNKRLALLNIHLNLLSDHPHRFIIRAEGDHKSRVDMTAITNRLIQCELDTMIQARFGRHGLRLVRLLREKGKLDDKQMHTYAMLEPKYMRHVLLQLQFAGLLDTQEIPKDTSRQPARSHYLWSFDEERTQSVFLQNTYFAMVRLLERVQVERDGRFRAVIEKAEQVKSRGKGENGLAAGERDMLRQWREVEEKLMVQVGRCDDVVAVLRDFGMDDGGMHV